MSSLLEQDKEFLQALLEANRTMINLSMQIIDSDRLCVAASGAESVKNCIGKYSRPDGAIARHYLKGVRRVTISHPGESENCIGCADYKSCPRSLYNVAVFAQIIVDGEIIGVLGAMANDKESNDLILKKEKAVYDYVESLADLIAHRVSDFKRAGKMSLLNSLLSKTISSIPQGLIVLDTENRITMLNTLFMNYIGDSASSYVGRHISALFPKLDDDYIAFHLDDHRYHELRYNALHFTAEFVPLLSGDRKEGLLIYLDESKATYSKAWEMTDASVDITFEDILGEDPAFLDFKRQVRSVAGFDSTILLTGETGVGKEMFARAIHNYSPRKTAPFVAINCGAIPDTLIESELFGYDKGAFTGASSQGKHGKFFMANGGTLFLDEVENTPLFMQQKLLRVLETGEFERVGGTKSIKVDVRIIAASNGHLDEMVKNGTFRKDLFHRLSVLPFLIPPLRERGGDVLLLADHYLRRYSVRYKKQVLGLDDDLRNYFLSYAWEGNIRELQNVIEYAVSMCNGNRLSMCDLPYFMHPGTAASPQKSLHEVENEYIRKIIASTGFGNARERADAAAILGISQATLYRKLKEFDIQP